MFNINLKLFENAVNMSLSIVISLTISPSQMQRLMESWNWWTMAKQDETGLDFYGTDDRGVTQVSH